MEKEWKDYLDENGLVTQKQSLGGDGGDSLNRTSVACFLGNLTGLFPVGVFPVFDLTDEKGKWRRSIHPDKWYSEYNRTSRDQLTPLLILLGYYKLTPELWLAFKDHLKRGLLFAYNFRRNHVYEKYEDHIKYSTSDVEWNYNWKLPDITGPEFWALYIRGFFNRGLYPILYLLDCHTLLGSFVIRFNKQDDVINHICTLEYAKVRMDTFVMKLARWITPRSLLQKRLDNFFGPEIESPINELYRSLK